MLKQAVKDKDLVCDSFGTLKKFKISAQQSGELYSLPALAKKLGIDLSRLPISIRIVLESVLRNFDGKKVTETHIRQLANWEARGIQ